MEKNSATKPTYFFFFCKQWTCKAMCKKCVEGPSYWGDNTFTELFTQNILDKEGLKQ